MDFEFECPYYGADCWVFCRDVGWFGIRYQAPAEVECWCCEGDFHPVFD
ncbi:hypothetical protein [Streptomyces sp. 8L]|nr:hypothetical protein [Streptomyces sp. 8L]MCA1223330.1 hypothetical protein [Streptomyces sp. 8L]